MAAELAVSASPSAVLQGSPTPHGAGTRLSSRETLLDAPLPVFPQLAAALEGDHREANERPSSAAVEDESISVLEDRLMEAEISLQAVLRDHEGSKALAEELGWRLHLAEDERDQAVSEAEEAAALLRGVVEGLGARIGAANALANSERAQSEAARREVSELRDQVSELQRLVEELGGSNEQAVGKIRALREERDALMATAEERYIRLERARAEVDRLTLECRSLQVSAGYPI